MQIERDATKHGNTLTRVWIGALQNPTEEVDVVESFIFEERSKRAADIKRVIM